MCQRSSYVNQNLHADIMYAILSVFNQGILLSATSPCSPYRSAKMWLAITIKERETNRFINKI